MDRLLTENEVAELLRVDTRTVRRWRAEKKIPFFTLPGRAIRFSANAVNVWLNRNCPKPREADATIQ